jgi:hypothetical protein
MPLQTMTHEKDGNGNSDSGDDHGGSNDREEDKGGDVQTTIN